jgi:hypothetical protein
MRTSAPSIRLLWHAAFAALLLAAASRSEAEPYIAVEMGLKCSQCHVNPTGGGMRNAYGEVYAQTLLPMEHLGSASDVWTGSLNAFLGLGGDMRYDATVNQVRGQPSMNEFQMEQTRVYLDASVIPDRLLVYADEQVAPGGAINREAYVLYWGAGHDWYVKAGQMYLPFGFRLQDQTALVQQVSGINMTTPDSGAEVGYLKGPWDAQLDASNGTAGGPVVSDGKQYTGNVSFVQPWWRFGVSLDENNSAADGRRTAYGVYAGLKTGPVAWLAEVDAVVDHTVQPSNRSAAGLLEADWLIMRGNNLKITAEEESPDLEVGVRRNGEMRWSAVYELTPVQFLQLRAGLRYLDGIPQDDEEHTKQWFFEVHGFF